MKYWKAFTIGILLTLLVAIPVLGQTALNLFTYSVNSMTGANYTNIGLGITENNSGLTSQGYMNGTGLDLLVRDAGGTQLPSMVADNTTYFVAPTVTVNSPATYLATVYNTSQLASMNIITGYGGNVTVADAPNLEPRGNFTLSQTGYFLTSAGANKTLWYKPGAINSNITGMGNITTTLILSANPTANISIDGVGNTTNVTTLVGAVTQWQAVLTNDGDTSYIANNDSANREDSLFTAVNLSAFRNFTVSNIVIHAVAKELNNGYLSPLTPLLYIGGVKYSGNATGGLTPGSYVDYSLNATWTSNPNTGLSWTVSDIDAIQIGVGINKGDVETRVTQLYAVITFHGTQSITASGISSGNHTVTTNFSSPTGNFSIIVDGVTNNSYAVNGTATVADSVNDWLIFTDNTTPYASNITISVNNTLQASYYPNTIILGTNLPNRASSSNNGTFNFGVNPANVNANLTAISPQNRANAPAYNFTTGGGFIGGSPNMSGNFTAQNVTAGGAPGAAFIESVANSGATPTPPIMLYGLFAAMGLVLFGLLISWMEKNFGATKEVLFLRIGLGAGVFGVMLALQKFDWWMLFFYLVVVFTVYLFRPPDGNVEQLNLIGFLASSWIGLTLINRLMEAQFITSTETNFLNSFAFTTNYKVLGFISVPILNPSFVDGLVHLFKWDYSFFGGNAIIIQYMLYSFTLVGSFMLFGMLIYMLFGYFKSA